MSTCISLVQNVGQMLFGSPESESISYNSKQSWSNFTKDKYQKIRIQKKGYMITYEQIHDQTLKERSKKIYQQRIWIEVVLKI